MSTITIKFTLDDLSKFAQHIVEEPPCTKGHKIVTKSLKFVCKDGDIDDILTYLYLEEGELDDNDVNHKQDGLPLPILQCTIADAQEVMNKIYIWVQLVNGQQQKYFLLEELREANANRQRSFDALIVDVLAGNICIAEKVQTSLQSKEIFAQTLKWYNSAIS